MLGNTFTGCELADAVNTNTTTLDSITTPSVNIFNKDGVTHGYYNNNGNIGASASYCYTNNIPASEGQTYITSENIRFVSYYDMNDSFISGTSVIYGGNTFTIPANVAYMIITAYESNIDTLQIELGTSMTAYQSYGYSLSGKPEEEIIALESEIQAINSKLGAKLTLNGSDYAYIVSDYSGETIKQEFKPYPTLTIDYSYNNFQLRNMYLNDILINEQFDDIAPDHVMNTTLGSNHGYEASHVTMVSHGKTLVDCGSIWSDGTNEYLLISIIDNDTLFMGRRDINSGAIVTTYTHVSGATNTADIVASAIADKQWYVPYSNYSISTYVDSNKINETTGEYSYKDSVKFIESYDIMSRADIVTWFEANGSLGQITPEGDGHIRVVLTHSFDIEAQYTIYREWIFLKDTEVSDLMGLQSLPTSANEYYIPNTLPFTYDGNAVDYTLKESATLTTDVSQSSIVFDSSNIEASGSYADRVLALSNINGKDYVFSVGFLPVQSIDSAVRRTNCSSYALQIRGNSNKLYFKVLSKGAFTALAGEKYSAIGYRTLTSKPVGKTALYWVRTRDNNYLYADWHNVSKIDTVALPQDFVGKNFEVYETKNVTVMSDSLSGIVSANVNATGSYAYMILKIV